MCWRGGLFLVVRALSETKILCRIFVCLRNTEIPKYRKPKNRFVVSVPSLLKKSPKK